MILNTFLKSQNIVLSKKEKCFLGRRIAHCYKSIYPDSEFKKVRISEKGCVMLVIDYPKDFLQGERVSKIVKKFTQKQKSISNN